MQFNKLMEDNNITDENVETKGDVMLISIGDAAKPVGWRRQHFAEEHPNVMIMHFDDVEHDGIPVILGGGTAVAFSEKMARDLYAFIKRNAHRKTCIVHCEAGISRSGAVGTFIQGLYGNDWDEFKRVNRHISPNARVARMLNQEKYKDKK